MSGKSFDSLFQMHLNILISFVLPEHAMNCFSVHSDASICGLQKYPPSATTLHFEFYAEPGSEVKVEKKVQMKSLLFFSCCVFFLKTICLFYPDSSFCTTITFHLFVLIIAFSTVEQQYATLHSYRTT